MQNTTLETKASLAAKIEVAQESKFQTIIRINRVLEAQVQDLYIQLEAKDEDPQSGVDQD